MRGEWDRDRQKLPVRSAVFAAWLSALPEWRRNIPIGQVLRATQVLEPRDPVDRRSVLLQTAGVRAAVVQTAEDLNEHDPQLAERGVFFEMDHPVIGPARFEAMPIRFSRLQQRHWRSGPLLGEDSRYVLTDILEMEPAEVDALAREGVI